MIRRTGFVFDRWARRFMPDPMLFAVILSFVAFALGLVFTDSSPMQMMRHWYGGFWSLLEFGMQMCLILVTGHALATSPAVRKCINKCASLPRSQSGFVFMCAFTTGVMSLINWGLGIIWGALLAREAGRVSMQKNIRVHYPLLAAASYAGFLVWHQGLSGSAPLLVATENHFLVESMGIIPTSETLFSPMNIVMSAGLLIVIPLICVSMVPRGHDAVTLFSEVDRGTSGDDVPIETDRRNMVIAERLENSRALSFLTGASGMVYVVWYFASNGMKLNLNIVNFTFLFTGILLQGRPVNYIRAVSGGVKACSGIIVQFPFYAGIMGMMKGSGLAGVMACWFVSISGSATYPVYTFLSAGLVNLFVPSGGGQWAVQGPIMVEAAKALDLSMPRTVMAVAYGDQWTNMLQPFWALALLGITGLKAREIVGYTMVVMLLTGVLFMAGLLLLPV